MNQINQKNQFSGCSERNPLVTMRCIKKPHDDYANKRSQTVPRSSKSTVFTNQRR